MSEFARIDVNDMGLEIRTLQRAKYARGDSEMGDTPWDMWAQFVEISSHLPAQSDQTRCSVRRYSLEIPRGRSANFCSVTF